MWMRQFLVEHVEGGLWVLLGWLLGLRFLIVLLMDITVLSGWGRSMPKWSHDASDKRSDEQRRAPWRALAKRARKAHQ